MTIETKCNTSASKPSEQQIDNAPPGAIMHDRSVVAREDDNVPPGAIMHDIGVVVHQADVVVHDHNIRKQGKEQQDY